MGAEGGEVPRAYNPALGPRIAEDPDLIYLWSACGIRPCCWNDASAAERSPANKTKKGKKPNVKPWVPWFAEANPARFPYLFPSEEAMAHCEELECINGSGSIGGEAGKPDN